MWSSIPMRITVPGPWKQIVSIRETLHNRGVDIQGAISVLVGNGSKTAFWLDTWAGPSQLNEQFPRLFFAEKHKQCLVRDRVSWQEGGPVLSWEWLEPVVGQDKLAELVSLESLICTVAAAAAPDRFIWNLHPSGVFSVASLKKHIIVSNHQHPQQIFKWNSWVPKKVGIVMWRAVEEKLPTRSALKARNINTPTDRCAFCETYAESCEHIFVSCHFAQTVWQLIAQWWRIEPIWAFGLQDILQCHSMVSGSERKKKAANALIHIVVWSIWKARNEVVFRQNQPLVSRVIEEVKTLGYLWIRNRSKDGSINWERWSSFNIF